MFMERGLSTRLKRLLVFILLFCILFSYTYNQNLLSNRYTEVNTSEIAFAGTVEGWDFNTSRDASQYIQSDNATIIKPKSFCESASFLLIIVCSAPANILHRNAIRESWGSQRNVSGKSISLYFLMGDSGNDTLQNEIMKEVDKYDDVIQDHFIDSYNNLTLKSIVLLKMVSVYCSPQNVTFLMKTDDDMFVNMSPLIKTLSKSNTTNVLVGSLICGAKPIKDATNKWYAPNYMYSGKVYPNYLSGTGYLMSYDVVPKLYEAALTTPIFHLEDIYITGILAKVTGVRPRNNGGFTFLKRKFDPCVYKTAFTSHRLAPSEIRDQYLMLQTLDLDKECEQEIVAHNKTFNIFGYFAISKPKPKVKKKKITCF